ncbi:MAG: thiol reductase thioredoxin [Christensenellaceae bacterium]|jgi:thioredoxin 1|nr:thiol reductase thioredoxin [Christensenellaceae bacterium]
MSEKVKILTVDNFQDTIAEDKLSLVDFWATWCGPCKMLHPLIDEAANIIGDRINVCRVDVDVCPDLAEIYKIMSVPTLLVFECGTLIERLVGVRPIMLKLDSIKKI